MSAVPHTTEILSDQTPAFSTGLQTESLDPYSRTLRDLVPKVRDEQPLNGDSHLESRLFYDYAKTTSAGVPELTPETNLITGFSGIGSCTLSLSPLLGVADMDENVRVNLSPLPGHSGDKEEFDGTTREDWDCGVSRKLMSFATYTDEQGTSRTLPQTVLAYSGSVPSVLKHEVEHPGSIKSMIMVSPLFYVTPAWGMILSSLSYEPAKSVSRVFTRYAGLDTFSYSKQGYTSDDMEYLDITMSEIGFNTLTQFVPVARGGRQALETIMQRSTRPEIFAFIGAKDDSLDTPRTVDFLTDLGIEVTLYEDSNHRVHLGPDRGDVWASISRLISKNL